MLIKIYSIEASLTLVRKVTKILYKSRIWWLLYRCHCFLIPKHQAYGALSWLLHFLSNINFYSWGNKPDCFKINLNQSSKIDPQTIFRHTFLKTTQSQIFKAKLFIQVSRSFFNYIYCHHQQQLLMPHFS